MESPSIFLSAGDPSGDNASARVVEVLKHKYPDLNITGLGGERLKKLGQKQLASGKDLAVLGFWEVARNYLFFRKLFHTCLEEIKTNKPDVILLVDYPGFNLRLAKKVKELNIPIIYYITPQVWAWGKNRVNDIRELIDVCLVILPFEKEFFDNHNVKSEFVGHYLLEDIPSNFISSLSSKKIDEPATIGLLPGSRPQEIERMLEPMLLAAKRFNNKYGTKAKVAAIKGVYDYEQAINKYSDDDITIEYNNARQLIFESTMVVTASGTATLETGIIGRPMVVIYRTGEITFQIAKRLVKLDKIALANLVMDEKVVPELIQHDASPEGIFLELEKFWNDNEYYDQTVEKLKNIPIILGGTGASERTAKIISEKLK